MKQWKGLLSAFILILITGLAGCGGPSSRDGLEEPATVLVAQAKKETRQAQFSYQALLQLAAPLEISAQVPGRVENVPVRAGQAVNRGDLLIGLHDETFVLALNNARQEAEQARLQEEKLQARWKDLSAYLQQQQTLFASGAVSRRELEKSQLELQLLEQDLKQAGSQRALALNKQRQAELNLSLSSITALDHMTVAAVLAVPGQYVAAGQPLIRGGNTQKLQVAVELSREEAADWQLGDKLKVKARGQEKEAVVSHISSLVLPGTPRIEVVLEIENDDLAWNPGEWAVITGDITIPEQVVVPLEAVAQGDSPYVYTVRQGRLHKQAVTLGAAEGSYLAVEGLEAGTLVVNGGLQRLRNGQRVNYEKAGDA